MKVLFAIFHNNEAYGIRILHSILSQKHDCKMLFIEDEDPYLIMEAINDFYPDVLGLSLTSPNFGFYKQLYPPLRQGHFKILLGGWQATLEADECLKYCDIVCRGEGELVIEKIIDDIEKNSFSNVYIGDFVNKVDHPLPLLNNKNSIWIKNGQILHEEPFFKNYRYGTTIGRGCPYSCTYCSNSYMKEMYPKWGALRFRGYDVVMEELLYAKKHLPNINTIVFYDEIFIPPMEGLENFLKRYKEEINLPFYCLFYPGTCKEDRAKLLRDAGLEGVWMGVQSGSERVRKEVFERYGKNETILKQVEIFRKYNIKIRYDFIFDNPFETPEEFQETLQLIKSLPKHDRKSINMFKMRFFPNTKLTQMAIEKGIIDKDNNDFYNMPEKLNEEQQEKIWKIIENL